MVHSRLILSFLALLLSALFSTPSIAQDSSFRRSFIANYIGNRFNEQVALVKSSKDAMPGEIKSLISEAMVPGNTFEKKMYLLDVANAMASMYKHWHNDDGPLLEVETIQRMEIKKEEERRAEAEKWNRYDKFLGNILMKEHMVQMDREGLPPVVFPHWLHRVWFECRVCHQDIFVMSWRGNDISYSRIIEGRQCGVCHNGKTAFNANEKCEVCHNAGKPGWERLFDPGKADQERIKTVAKRVGAGWNPENLPNGKIPMDRYGYIDWLLLKAKGVFSPVGSLDGKKGKETRDTAILFESTSPAVNNVLFDHKVHTAWIDCSTCHPSVFKDSVGNEKISMTDMGSGKYCGYCHGKVSFTFADCLRCHNQPKDKTPKGALIHRGTR